jgi:tRNA-dihydrouridine synthase
MASEGGALAGVITSMQTRGDLFEEDWIDLNVGCPSRRVNAHGAGAALLKQPRELERIVLALRAAHKGPLSIKTRLGFDSAEELKPLCGVFANLPIDFLTIHARTRCGGYHEAVRRDLLREVCSLLPFPVIGNGDIFSAADAREVLEDCGARGVMCGRGAVRNPLLFRQIQGEVFTEEEHRNLIFDFATRLLIALKDDLGTTKACGPAKEFLGLLSQNPLIGRVLFERCKRQQDVDSMLREMDLLSTEEPKGPLPLTKQEYPRGDSSPTESCLM